MFTKIIHVQGNIMLPQLGYSDIRNIYEIPSLEEIINEMNGIELINENERDRLINAINEIYKFILSTINNREYTGLFNTLRLGVKGKSLKIQASNENKKLLLDNILYPEAIKIYKDANLTLIPGIPHPKAIVRLILMNLIRDKRYIPIEA